MQGDDKPQIQLTFNVPPNDVRRGFVFGSNRKVCDVVFGTQKDAISGRHFSIGFDAYSQVVVRDSSKKGTQVSYDGQGTKQTRKNFTWILFEWVSKIEIIIPETEWRFEVRLRNHTSCEPKYRRRLDAYFSDVQESLLPLRNLGIDSQESTANPTKAPRKQSPLYFRDLVFREGNFGIVYRAWDVSSGLCYAEK